MLSLCKPIADYLFSFFFNQLGIDHGSNANINLQETYKDEILDLSSLQEPFTVTEVKRAIFSNAPEKVPCPDGFSMLFYQRFWSLLKNDIMGVFSSFYNGTATLDEINSS
uniref:Reverse transcriptase n=1 Tax=Ananas comosus var. bracteatus TaxID=296719 RepID=A0A6V7Q3B6_ANACO|nr:unnamed protein product [Ananas comosus var. bracteatus]